MYSWTKPIAVAATLAAGCAQTLDDPAADQGAGAATGAGSIPGLTAGSGAGASPGTGANGGATASGATPGVGSAQGGVGSPSSCTPGIPGTSQLPRLTRAQYDNTVRDLLGLDAQPSSLLAPDSPGSVDQRAWSGYKAAAESLAPQVLTNTAARAQVIPCTPSGDGSVCARQFIESFGRRAFRRPLTSAELARFEMLYANRAELTARGTFDEAAELIVRVFLMSPSFLTRAEIAEQPEGAAYVLNGYEIASRLSYMLWGSMPDEPLFAAAAAGTLSTPQGILAEAQRLLMDPKARSKVRAFHEHYAHMGEGTRWAAIQRDPKLYPSFSAAMVPLLSEETTRFFEHVVFDLKGTFRDLLTSRVGFVNKALAPLYGLDAAQHGAELVAVNLDPATRSGVFTRAGFLTANSLYNRPSAILRGAFIQKEVLCTPIGAPPPGAESTPQPVDGLATNRERTDAQTSGGDCRGCHLGLINPTGFAFEMYDAMGALQTSEKDTGAPIDARATIPLGPTTVSVSNAVELMDALANSPEARACYAKKWVQYAYERTLAAEDACTVTNLASKLTQEGYTVQDLIVDLTQSQSFRYRTLEVTP